MRMGATTPDAGGSAGAPVAPRTRFLAALAAWMMIALAQPGLFRHEGLGHWAFVALAPGDFLNQIASGELK